MRFGKWRPFIAAFGLLLAGASGAETNDAIVNGPLRTVTWITPDSQRVRRFLIDKLHLRDVALPAPIPEVAEARRSMWGFTRDAKATEFIFEPAGQAGGADLRLIGASQRVIGARAALSAAETNHPLGFVIWNAPVKAQARNPPDGVEVWIKAPETANRTGIIKVNILVNDLAAEIGFYTAALGLVAGSEYVQDDATGHFRAADIKSRDGNGAYLTLLANESSSSNPSRPSGDMPRGAAMQGVATQGAGLSGLTYPVGDILLARSRVLAVRGQILWGPVRMVTAYFGDHKVMMVRTPGGTVLELVQFTAQ